MHLVEGRKATTARDVLARHPWAITLMASRTTPGPANRRHHEAVMAHADWIIGLGPGAGHDGGRIVFEGTPAALVAARSTLTGEHLAAYVGHP